VILWERSASRRRMVSRVKGSWAGRGSDDESDVEEGIGSSGGGTSRPATNITGASWTNNSGGYEFMLQQWSSEEMKLLAYPRTAPQIRVFQISHQTTPECATTTTVFHFFLWNLLSLCLVNAAADNLRGSTQITRVATGEPLLFRQLLWKRINTRPKRLASAEPSSTIFFI
jgi:hypothetical protein